MGEAEAVGNFTETNHGLRHRNIQVRLAEMSCMAFLAYPLVGLITENPFYYLALAAFIAGYTRTIVRNTPDLHLNQAPLTIAATLASGVPLLPVLGFAWLAGLSFFTSVMLLVNCPLRWWRMIVVSLVVVFGALGAGVFQAGPNELLQMTLLILITSGVQVAIFKQIDTSFQLQQARAGLTQLAVTEERLRITRDLHDVLGQRLSVIALKAEYAAQTVHGDPRRAEAEMIEVVTVAHDTLAEVRATVSGYRQASLAAELRSAEDLLTAAGVKMTVQGELHGLPNAVEECAAWVVREAATNAVRHAQARCFAIELSRAAGWVLVEARDDGVGAARREPPPFGRGLTGLAERVAEVGGELVVGPRAGRLTVRARLPAALHEHP